MFANVGDHLVLRATGVAGHDLRGEIVEDRGDAGAPPYVVRWPDGHESLFAASPDAYVDPAADRCWSVA